MNNTQRAVLKDLVIDELKFAEKELGPAMHPKLASKMYNREWITEEDILSIGGLPIKWKWIAPEWKNPKAVCGYAKNGYVFLFGSLAKELYKEWTKEIREKEKYTEEDLRKEIMSILEKEYKVTKNLKTSCGYMDIFAENKKEQLIIEIKKNPDGHQILIALGQLLTYSLDYPNAKLVFYSNKELSLRHKEVLQSYNIDIRKVNLDKENE